MNRKQKIIVSVTGIFIVLLILMGLTYAYYLTNIIGNTNPKSISIETADLELEYTDGDSSLITSDVIFPSNENYIGTKTFTVTNKGDDTTYAVIIENVKVTDGTTGNITSFDSNDFRYKIVCTKKDGTSCNGAGEDEEDPTKLSVLPLTDAKLLTNDIAEDDAHTYTLTLWYIDTGVDQSSDMNKLLEAKINIEDPNRYNELNPYFKNTDSLAYNIINNALNVNDEQEAAGYAVYRSVPLTKVGESTAYATGNKIEETRIMNPTGCMISVGETPQGAYNGAPRMCDAGIVSKYIYSGQTVPIQYVNSYNYDTGELNVTYDEYKTENTLSITYDELGPSYYFRGDIQNNFLEFNGMCWRIVRIEGDGSVKLVLYNTGLCSQDGGTSGYYIDTAIYGTDENGLPDYDIENNNSTINSKINSWYESVLSSKSSIIKDNYVCIGDINSRYDEHEVTGWHYDNYKRIDVDKNPSLYCSDNQKTKNQYKAYVLTIDEEVFAGIAIPYLGGDYFPKTYRESYMNDNSGNRFTASFNYYDKMMFKTRVYSILGNEVSYSSSTEQQPIRPAISLVPGIELASNSGNGTKTSPYRVVES